MSKKTYRAYKEFAVADEDFFIRPISLDDVGESYLHWFQDNLTRKFISSANKMNSIEALRSYVSDRIQSPNCLFFGIFFRSSKLLIGTVKFEPINREERSAVVGLLMGNPLFRGRGIARASFENSLELMKDEFGIRSFMLTVSKENYRAIRIYESLGFKPCSRREDGSISMGISFQ